MKSEEFIDIIGDIEEEYLIKAHEERKIKKVIPMKKVFALIAAVLLIAATSTVVVGISKQIFFTEVSEIDSELYEKSKDAVVLKVNLEYITEEEIGNELDGLKEYLRGKGYPNEKRSYRWTFLTQQRAMEALGCERVIMPDWGEEAIEKGTYLDVDIRNTEGDFKIDKTFVGAEFDIGNIHVYSAAEMAFTELGSEYTVIYSYLEDAETEEEYITSKTGAEGIKVTGHNVKFPYPVTPLGKETDLHEETVVSIEAKIVKNKVKYAFHAVAPPGEEEKLEELYEYWLSCY
ncbi:MAG: hypothetical protein IJ945_09900 [Oscillospiraceae bacterium]|nr:hypothetical protein [Oscillospiraceae bacterium]